MVRCYRSERMFDDSDVMRRHPMGRVGEDPLKVGLVESLVYFLCG